MKFHPPAITAADLPIDPRLRSAAVALLKRGVPERRVLQFFATGPEQLRVLVGGSIRPPQVRPAPPVRPA